MKQKLALSISYRVPADPKDPSSYVAYQSPFHKIRKKQSDSFKWVERKDLPAGFLDAYIASIEEAIDACMEDNTDEPIHAALHEIPYLEGAEVVIVDFTWFHKGEENGFPRHQTKIHLAYEFDSEGRLIMEDKSNEAQS